MVFTWQNSWEDATKCNFCKALRIEMSVMRTRLVIIAGSPDGAFGSSLTLVTIQMLLISNCSDKG